MDLSRRVFCLGAAGFLAACTAMPSGGIRDTRIAIPPRNDFSPARFAGDWFQVAYFRQRDTSWNFGTERYRYDPSGNILWRSSGDFPVYPASRSGFTKPIPFKVLPGGAIQIDRDENYPVGRVIWIDDAYQTAILGEASGAHTRVLARPRYISANRMNAAKAVLETYGYDMSKMIEKGA